MKQLLLLALVAGCGSKAAPAKQPTPNLEVQTMHPTTMDTTSFARLAEGRTDWSTFVSKRKGVVVVSANAEVARRCGDEAVALLRESVAKMRGATCEQYESDGVACTAGDTSLMFDKDGDTWEAYGLLLMPQDKVTPELEEQFGEQANQGSDCPQGS